MSSATLKTLDLKDDETRPYPSGGDSTRRSRTHYGCSPANLGRRQHGIDRSLLAYRQPAICGSAEKRAGGVWRADCRHAVARISGRVWSGIHGKKPAPDDSVCRVVSRGRDCRHAVATIELVALPRTAAPEPALSARVLRGDVPYRGLERAYPAAKDRLHALRANRSVETARRANPGRAGFAAQPRGSGAVLAAERPVCTRLPRTDGPFFRT